MHLINRVSLCSLNQQTPLGTTSEYMTFEVSQNIGVVQAAHKKSEHPPRLKQGVSHALISRAGSHRDSMIRSGTSASKTLRNPNSNRFVAKRPARCGYARSKNPSFISGRSHIRFDRGIRIPDQDRVAPTLEFGAMQRFQKQL